MDAPGPEVEVKPAGLEEFIADYRRFIGALENVKDLDSAIELV